MHSSTLERPKAPARPVSEHSAPVRNPLMDEVDWFGLYKQSGSADKVLFTEASTAHPAKMAPLLCRRIFDQMKAWGWLRDGDLVIDPFGGRGTTALLWCGLSPENRAVTVELEGHFVQIQRDCKAHASRKLGRDLPYAILRGDSRKADLLLRGDFATTRELVRKEREQVEAEWRADWSAGSFQPLGEWAGGPGYAAAVAKRPWVMEAWPDHDPLADLRPEGCVTSPPYFGNDKRDNTCEQRDQKPQGRGCFRGSYAHHVPGQIGNMPDGIGGACDGTSAPYADTPLTGQRNFQSRFQPGEKRAAANEREGYGATEGQIGAMADNVCAVTSAPYFDSLASGNAAEKGGLFRDPKRANDRTLTGTYVHTGNSDSACHSLRELGHGQTDAPRGSGSPPPLLGRREHVQHCPKVRVPSQNGAESPGSGADPLEGREATGAVAGQDLQGRAPGEDPGLLRPEPSPEHEARQMQPSLPVGGQEGNLRTLRDQGEAGGASPGHGPQQQRPVEPRGAVQLMSPLGAQEALLGLLPRGEATAEDGQESGLDPQATEDLATGEDVAGQAQGTGSYPACSVLSAPYEAQDGGSGEASRRSQPDPGIQDRCGYKADSNGNAEGQIGKTQGNRGFPLGSKARGCPWPYPQPDPESEDYATACLAVYQAMARAGVRYLASVTKNPTRKTGGVSKLRRLDKLTARLLRLAGYRVVAWRRAWLWETESQQLKRLGQTPLFDDPEMESNRPIGRLSFFKRLHLSKGIPAAQFEDIIFCELDPRLLPQDGTACCTSPPYASTEIMHSGGSIGEAWKDGKRARDTFVTPAQGGPLRQLAQYGLSEGQIGRAGARGSAREFPTEQAVPESEPVACITSAPYVDSEHQAGREKRKRGGDSRLRVKEDYIVPRAPGQIAALRDVPAEPVAESTPPAPEYPHLKGPWKPLSQEEYVRPCAEVWRPEPLPDGTFPPVEYLSQRGDWVRADVERLDGDLLWLQVHSRLHGKRGTTFPLRFQGEWPQLRPVTDSSVDSEETQG